MGEKTAEDLREEWIRSAEVILGNRKGHMGIITFLRDQGLDPEQAKRVSFDIFDEGKRRLMRSQLGYRIAGWFLIFVGLFTPLALLILQSRIVMMSAAPLIGGAFFLGKVINPSPLPRTMNLGESPPKDL